MKNNVESFVCLFERERERFYSILFYLSHVLFFCFHFSRAMALMATLRVLSISNTTAQLAFIAMNLLQKHSRLRLKFWLVVSLGKFFFSFFFLYSMKVKLFFLLMLL